MISLKDAPDTLKPETTSNGGKEVQNGNTQGVVLADTNVDTDAASSNGTRDTQNLTDIQYIILDCSTISYVDSMGVKVLRQVNTDNELPIWKSLFYLWKITVSVDVTIITVWFLLF